jgi:hypothetical protein
MGRGRTAMHAAGSRTVAALVLLLLGILLLPTIRAESAVTIDFLTALEETDIGIEALAFDDVDSILVVGADGYIAWIDSTTPTNNQRLESNLSETLRSIAFHSGGNALIGGDSGILLRYVASNKTVEPAGGTTMVEVTSIRAITWNKASSWAYIGGEGGWIWRYQAGENGTSEMHLLNNLRTSDIIAISCHAETPLCAIATKSDGIGIIDRNHNISWVGASGTAWTDVACTAKIIPRCVAIGEGRQLALISLQESAPEASDIGMNRYTEVAGEFRKVCRQDEERIMVATTPFSLMEYDLYQDSLYPWLNQSDAVTAGPVVAGSSIVCTWGEDKDTGFILTSRGDIVHFHPPAADGGITTSLVYIAVSVVVIICVPGVILGLIYMNSETMQKAYLQRRNKKREKRREEYEEANQDSGPASRRTSTK